MSKQCSKCKETKSVGEFYKHPRYKDGLRRHCKQCETSYKQANKDKIIEWRNEYIQNNREKISEQRKKYNYINREKIREWHKAFRQNNPEKGKTYREVNRKKITERKSEYTRQRRRTDPLYRLKSNLRLHSGRVKSKFGTKTRTAQLIGCSWEQAQTHLILTALTRYGYYVEGQSLHIDHIVPLASAKTEAEAIALSHISNLQYLTPADNLKKSDKLDHVFGEAV